MNYSKIYLASSLPRRRELLNQIAVNFDVIAVDVDETRFEGESPQTYVTRVALAKAEAGSIKVNGQLPVIGSDTSVVVQGKVLGKPASDEDARAMLTMLSGAEQQVLTAVAIVTENEQKILLNENKVRFANLSDDEIEWYLATGEGKDKAGGYAVQGLAAQFIEYIEGSYSGIMGLPLRETAVLLKQIGYCNE
jgi:septum formation protein